MSDQPQPDPENPSDPAIDDDVILTTPSRPHLLAAPFLNEIGDQNSYVNVIMHFLYNTPEITNHILPLNLSSQKQYSLLYNLQLILSKYTSLTNPDTFLSIPESSRYCDVSSLRKDLEILYKGENVFKRGQIGDPADLLFIFLNALHAYNKKAHSLRYTIEKECSPKCPSHEFIWIDLVQQYECANCNGTSDLMKFDYNYFMYELEIKDVLNKMQHMKKLEMFQNKLFMFFKEIHAKANGSCPLKCKNPALKRNLILMSIKEYLLFNISWKEINPSLCDICKFFFCLPQVMRNDDLFQVYVHDYVKTYSIYGMICYWGGQYVCYFKNAHSTSYMNSSSWIFHEDKTITQMNSWKDIIIHCMKNHYHPVMVFYRQSESRSSYFQDNSDLTERDYINMYRHCQRVDSASHSDAYIINDDDIPATNKDNIIYRSKLHSQLSSKGVVDDNMLKSIRNLQKMDELRKEGNDDNNKHVFDDNANSNIITLKGKEMIGLRPGEWQCRSVNCNNVNNCSTFQCVKCKAINLKVYEIIMANKQKKSSVNINTESKAIKYERLDKMYSSFNVIKKSASRDEDTAKGDEVKGSAVRVGSVLNSSRQRTSSYYGEEVNEHLWRCLSCHYMNEDNENGFCMKCKRNKPTIMSDMNSSSSGSLRGISSASSNNLFVDWQEPMVNGIKHYI